MKTYFIQSLKIIKKQKTSNLKINQSVIPCWNHLTCKQPWACVYNLHVCNDKTLHAVTDCLTVESPLKNMFILYVSRIRFTCNLPPPPPPAFSLGKTVYFLTSWPHCLLFYINVKIGPGRSSWVANKHRQGHLTFVLLLFFVHQRTFIYLWKKSRHVFIETKA